MMAIDERLIDERLSDERLIDERLIDEKLFDEQLINEKLFESISGCHIHRGIVLNPRSEFVKCFECGEGNLLYWRRNGAPEDRVYYFCSRCDYTQEV